MASFRTCQIVAGYFMLLWISRANSFTEDAVTHSHEIELLVVVDYSDYKHWYNITATDQADPKRAETTKSHIKTHVASLIKSSNLAYESLLKYGISIQLKLVDIVIMETAQQSPWTETVKFSDAGEELVIATEVFPKFIPFADHLQQTIPHDHAMILTRYVIHKENKTEDIALGVAKLSAECTPRSVSIVQDEGFSRANVIAHELGHSLGCEHDGTGNTCKDDDGYVMSVAQDVDHVNRWLFSSCSADYIKDYIKNITRWREMCLDTIENHHPVNLLHTAPWFGQLYNADKQCTLLEGEGSYFCRDHYHGGNFTSVCNHFLCHGLQNSSCYYSSDGMADGTPCGQGKWCMSNRCVDTTQPLNTTDKCFAGDQPGVVKNSKTCAQLVAADGNVCNNRDVKLMCCSSCRGVVTSSVNVNTQCMQKHGPRSQFCLTDDYDNNTSDALCSALYCENPKNHSECFSEPTDDKTICGSHKWCIDGKCVYNKDVPAQNAECTWSDVIGIAGYNVTCQQVAEPRNHHLCYKNSISKLCCNTCQSVKRKNASCLYGDKDPWCFANVANRKFKGECYSNGDVCCESCAKAVVNGAKGCEYGDKSTDCDGLLPNNNFWCYNSKNVDLCCGTCATIYNHSRQGCEYGDRSDWCVAHVRNMADKFNCYNNEDLCCESCHEARKLGTDDCPYGDHSDWCVGHIRNNTYKGGCYRNEKFCCGTCSKLRRTNQPGCEYGDHNSDCPTDIGGHVNWCYDAKNEHNCCDSCSKHANTGHPDCKYGDHFSNCDVHRCARYDADTRQKCCETCKDTAVVG